MRKALRLTESDLNRIVKRVINEGACPDGDSTISDLRKTLYQTQGRQTFNATVSGIASCWYLDIQVNGKNYHIFLQD